MNKKILTFAALAAVLGACSKNVQEQEVVQQKPVQQETAIGFGAYTSRGVTKAGQTGTLDDTVLKNGQDVGFGVFGYYTNGELYSETSRPDFMYNAQIWHNGSEWTYSPIKYWPNEFGSNAISEEVDRVSFFAYAPWVKVTPSTGLPLDATDEKTGITGLSRNTATGDPLVKYVVNYTPGAGVDLCWGVALDDFKDNVSEMEHNNISKDDPYLNVAKPTTNSKIAFNFKHALAQLNVKIDTDVDNVSPNHVNALNEFTRIYVRSITFEGFTTSGALNLNASASDGPKWYDLSGNARLAVSPVTIYDGRRDGKEGRVNAVASNELPKDLNPTIIQMGEFATTMAADKINYATLDDALAGEGVTHEAKNLFNNGDVDAPIMVIPNKEESLKISIVYDVETADATLPGYLSDGKTHGSSIENAISQELNAITMEAGKKYVINLHLGLTSAKFEAEVTPWDDSEYPVDVNLPSNSDAYQAGSSISYGMVPADANTISVSLTGLTEGAVLSLNETDSDFGGFTKDEVLSGEIAFEPATVGADGKATVTIPVAARTMGSVEDRAISLAIDETVSGSVASQTKVDFTQEGAAITGFAVASTSSNDTFAWSENIAGNKASTVSYEITNLKADSPVRVQTPLNTGVTACTVTTTGDDGKVGTDGVATVTVTFAPNVYTTISRNIPVVIERLNASNAVKQTLTVNFTQNPNN